jgi:hypothetical protein
MEREDETAPLGDAAPVAQDLAPHAAPPLRWISSYSSLYAIVREARARIVSGDYVSPFRDDDPPQDVFELCVQRPGRMKYDDQPTLRTVFLDPSRIRRYVDLSDARIQEGKRIAEEILLSMRDKLKETGSRLVVLLIPTKHLVYQELIEQSRDAVPDAYSRLLQSERELTDSLRAFLRDHGIEYQYAAPALQDCLRKGVRPYPESDDQHMNRVGYGVVAEALMSHLAASVERTVSLQAAGTAE